MIPWFLSYNDPKNNFSYSKVPNILARTEQIPLICSLEKVKSYLLHIVRAHFEEIRNENVLVDVCVPSIEVDVVRAGQNWGLRVVSVNGEEGVEGLAGGGRHQGDVVLVLRN